MNHNTSPQILPIAWGYGNYIDIDTKQLYWVAGGSLKKGSEKACKPVTAKSNRRVKGLEKFRPQFLTSSYTSYKCTYLKRLVEGSRRISFISQTGVNALQKSV